MSECFDCLTPPNYAAVALELQQTAMQAEACIFDLETKLRAAPNAPTQIRTSTGTYSFASGRVVTLQNPLPTTTLTFSTVPVTDFMATPLPAGVWEVGCYLNVTAVGTVNAETFRHLYITVKNQFAAPGSAPIYQATESAFEADIGNGMDMCLVTSVVVDGNQRVMFQMLHGNTSSNLEVQTGAIFWATRLSDPIALAVV